MIARRITAGLPGAFTVVALLPAVAAAPSVAQPAQPARPDAPADAPAELVATEGEGTGL